ncbi:MAG: HD domain-containing protein, partial [Nocardiopsis sp. BM-2018]
MAPRRHLNAWNDPVWGRVTRVEPLERALLERPELRRLAGLHHHGAAGRVLGWATTRWEHTLGVWTVVATLCPDDVALRLAALLHDVGHAPYSHALEPLGGIDHHFVCMEALERGPLGAWLRGAGVDTGRVAALVD